MRKRIFEDQPAFRFTEEAIERELSDKQITGLFVIYATDEDFANSSAIFNNNPQNDIKTQLLKYLRNVSHLHYWRYLPQDEAERRTLSSSM